MSTVGKSAVGWSIAEDDRKGPRKLLRAGSREDIASREVGNPMSIIVCGQCGEQNVLRAVDFGVKGLCCRCEKVLVQPVTRFN